MTKETQTVWTGGAGELLVRKDDDRFYIPLSTVSVQTLKELGEAIAEALADKPEKRP